MFGDNGSSVFYYIAFVHLFIDFLFHIWRQLFCAIVVALITVHHVGLLGFAVVFGYPNQVSPIGEEIMISQKLPELLSPWSEFEIYSVIQDISPPYFNVRALLILIITSSFNYCKAVL